MGDNPVVPPVIGRRVEKVCPSCGNRGMTVRAIDNERQFAIVQCDTCSKIAPVDIKFVFGLDDVAD
jgi:uncharacterized Zn finger protein